MPAVEQARKSGPRQGASLTLGDVLYADRTIPQEAEEAWVALVRAVAARDAQALHSLFQRSHRLVYTLAVRLTGRPQVAEEVMLRVFHDVWTESGSYRPADGTVLGWIMNQARSRALERSLKEKPAQVAAANPAARADEQARLLREALQGLTPEEREAIESAYFSELTDAQAAARVSQSPAVLRTWIHSGLAKLRQALTRNT